MTSSDTNSSRTKSAGLLLIFALFFALTFARSMRLVNMGLMDMDCIIDRSFRVFSGQVPYRDFFAPTAPLSYFTQAAWWKIFGPTAVSIKLYMSALNGVLAVLLFLFLKNTLRAGLPAIGLCLTLFAAWSPYSIFPTPWFNSDSSMAAFLGLVCLALFHEKRSSRWAFMGGLCCGLSCLYKQNDGAGAILAGGLFTLIVSIRNRDFKALVLFIAGAALPAAACGIYFAAHGALDDLFEWTVVRAGKGKVGQNPLFFLLGPVRTLFGPVCKFLRVIFLMYIAAWAVLEWRGRTGLAGRATLYRLMLLYAFLFSYFAYLSFAGINFAFYQIFIWVPFLVLWETLPSRWPRAAIALIAAGFVLNSLRITLWKHRAFHQPEMKIDYAFKTERLQGAYFYSAAGKPLDDLSEYLKANLPPQDNVWIFPEPLAAYFAIGRVSPNPVSAYGETDYEMLPEDQDAVIRSMEGKNVRWAALQLPFFNHHTQHAKYRRLMDHMIERYEFKEIVEPFIILYRPDDAFESSSASRNRVAELFSANPFSQAAQKP